MYGDAAESFGRLLASQGIRLVYGGGRVGLMGRVADGCLAGGGEVFGVITRQLQDLEVGHTDIQELRVVETMHERKRTMLEAADATVALPGGWGTLEEIFEAVTWSQLQLHYKPAGLWNIDGYFDHLVSFLDHAHHQGFMRATGRDLLKVSGDPEALLELLS